VRPVDVASIKADLAHRAGWSVTFVEPGSADWSTVPEQWHGVALSPDPEARRLAALQLWNQDFLDMLPRFTAALTTHLADVRVCVVDSDCMLLYVLEFTDQQVIRVGWDPRTFGQPPPFWESLPGPVRVFLQETHAGFTGPDQDSFGLVPPVYMVTLAYLADWPDGIPGWDEFPEDEGVERIPSTRLVRIGTDGGELHYCVSPDLPPGQIALVYEGDIDRQPFGPTLDELMIADFDDASG
jgi:hypothetical protein